MNQMLFLSTPAVASSEGTQNTETGFGVGENEQEKSHSIFSQLIDGEINANKVRGSEQLRGNNQSSKLKENELREASFSGLPSNKPNIAADVDLHSMSEEELTAFLQEQFPDLEGFLAQLPKELQQSFQSFLLGEELSVEQLQALQEKLVGFAGLPTKEVTPIKSGDLVFEEENNTKNEQSNSAELKGLVQVIAGEIQKAISGKRLESVMAKNEDVVKAQAENGVKSEFVGESLESKVDLFKENIAQDAVKLDAQGKLVSSDAQAQAKNPELGITEQSQERAGASTDLSKNSKSDNTDVSRANIEQKQQSELEPGEVLKSAKDGATEQEAKVKLAVNQTLNSELAVQSKVTEPITKAEFMANQPSKFAEPVATVTVSDDELAELEKQHRKTLVVEKLQDYVNQHAKMPGEDNQVKSQSAKVFSSSVEVSDDIVIAGAKTNVLGSETLKLSPEQLTRIVGQVTPEATNVVSHPETKQVIADPIRTPIATEQLRVQLQQEQQKQSDAQLDVTPEEYELQVDELVNSDAKSLEAMIKEQVVGAKTTPSTFVPGGQAQVNTTPVAHSHVADTSLTTQALSDFDANVAKTLEASLRRAENSAQVQETISILKKDFPEQVKENVLMMINTRMRQVDIRLDPPELGSMQVKLNMQGEQAQLNIVVQNQPARDALEQQMPRLRDLLAEQGVDLGETHVKQEQREQQGFDGEGQHANGQGGGLSGEEVATDTQTVVMNLNNSSASGIDYYA